MTVLKIWLLPLMIGVVAVLEPKREGTEQTLIELDEVADTFVRD